MRLTVDVAYFDARESIRNFRNAIMWQFVKRGGLLGVSVILICLNFVTAADFLTETTSYLKPCQIYEPGFTKCSTESIQTLLDAVIKGIPDIVEKIGPIDPMSLDIIQFKQDNNEAATLSSNLTDILISGFSKMRIKESKVSKKDFSWQTKVFVPKMRIDANYKMTGKILLIPLSGSGKMFIELDDLNMVLLTKTRLYEKGGFTFYNVTSVRVSLDMSRVRTNFENIFNGNNKEVERSTNEFFNENWRDFFEALRPLVEETVERILLRVLQEIFHYVPANFIVSDIPTSDKLYKQKA